MSIFLGSCISVGFICIYICRFIFYFLVELFYEFLKVLEVFSDLKVKVVYDVVLKVKE